MTKAEVFVHKQPRSMSDLNPWTVLNRRTVYENPWIRLEEHDVRNPKGGPGIYGVVHFKNRAIGIVALDKDLRICLVGQYRYPLDQYSWEIPEGGGPLSEEPLQAAQRELQEETGLKAAQWQELMRMHLSNSVSDELAIIYLARGLSQHEACPEDTEDLSRQNLELDEAYRMVLDGRITDSISVAAILRLRIMQLEGNLS